MIGVMGTADLQLTMEELRLVTRYVAECAEEVLPVYEAVHPDNRRPRAAVDSAWGFVHGAKRNKLLRTCSLEAHRAAKEVATEPARPSARAAADAASAAYLHPIAKATQVGHILRGAACAACIAEIQADGDQEAAKQWIDRARRSATPKLIDVLRRYPPPTATRGRVATLMSDLDTLLRHTS